MEYTTNYHLPQWVESDRIMMGDFNEAMASIEEGIYTAQEAAGAAQSAANNAQDSADAVAANAYSPSNKPYAVGSYTGTNMELTITLGFRPSFLIISGATAASSSSVENLSARNIFTGGNVLNECVTFTDTGFTITKISNTIFPQLCTANRVYDYIAFR